MEARRDLVDLSDYVYERTLSRLQGLSDAEYLWEPAPGCWSVRTGMGTVAVDWAPMPDSPPFTTIAWRLVHLIRVYADARNERWLHGTDDGRFPERSAPRSTAAEALESLADAAQWWRGHLTTVTEDELSAPLGPEGGVYALSTRAGFVLHMIDEMIHHAAEIGTLRDLYANTIVRGDEDPMLEAVIRGERPADVEGLKARKPDLVRWAAANGHWRAVPVLVDLGFDVNASAAGATALHHAAAAHRLDEARLLVEHGADTNRVDDHFHATPAGWAEYFQNQTLVDYLATVSQP